MNNESSPKYVIKSGRTSNREGKKVQTNKQELRTQSLPS